MASRTKHNSIFYFIIFIILISGVFNISDDETIKTISYVSQVACMFYMLVYSFFHLKHLKKSVRYFLILFTILLLINSYLAPSFALERKIKLINSVLMFCYGYTLTLLHPESSVNISKKLVFLIWLIPVIFAFFLREKTGFSVFFNSNGFAFFGIILFVLIYYVTKNLKYAFAISFLYFILGVTIGAILSFVLAIFFYNIKTIKLKRIFGILFMLSILLLLINYSDIPVFVRIKNSMLFMYNYSSVYSVREMIDSNYSEALTYASSANDTSFLFRLKHWTEIWDSLSSSNLIEILFGHGDGSPKYYFRLNAHNDYLSILYEYGAFMFLILLYAFYSILKKLIRTPYSIPLMAIAIFSVTENLYDNYIATSILYFIIGTILAQINNPQEVTNT